MILFTFYILLIVNTFIGIVKSLSNYYNYAGDRDYAREKHKKQDDRPQVRG